MDLKKLNLQNLSLNEEKQINGGNGVHGAGYGVAQDMGAVGAITVGVVVGFVKGIARRWFG